MKRLTILLLLIVPFMLKGQDSLRLHPCGTIPDTYIDLNNDGFNDLNLAGFQVGTDDVPSSSGYCSLGVRAVQKAFIVYTKTPEGITQPFYLTPGTKLLTDDINAGFINGTYEKNTNVYVSIADWGYGNNTTPYKTQEKILLLYMEGSEAVYYWIKVAVGENNSTTITDKGYAKNGVLNIN